MLSVTLAFCLAAAPGKDAAAPPDPILWSGHRLAAAKAAHAAGGAGELRESLETLIAEADGAAGRKPPTVMDKIRNPPSGDKHDYVSQALYWWPDPSKPDGLPYIQKDGQANPETKDWQDRENLGDMAHAVEVLSQAYFVTGKPAYAAHCAEYLRAWFLAPATRMNPHLDYAQFIPGVNNGRGTGLIETRDLIVIPDALVLLEGSGALSAPEISGLRAWFAAYFRWFRDSANGKEEADARNNHGTFYDAQAIVFSLFAGESDSAAALALASRSRRFPEQIAVDGSLPEELRRTNSLHYVAFTLGAFFQLAAVGEAAGVDFWNHRTADGRSLRQAMDWAQPYFLGEKAWTWQQISDFNTREAMLAFLQAAEGFHDRTYWQAATRVKGVTVAQDRAFLLYHPDSPVSVSAPAVPIRPDARPGDFDALGRAPADRPSRVRLRR